MSKSKEPTPNLRLKHEREIRGWSQEVLAEKIGASPFSISQWELGRKTPGPHNRKMLCELFGKNAVELGFVEDQIEDAGEQYASRSLHEQEQPFPEIWNVPEPSPFYTGREDILQSLHEALIQGKATALTQAISGLGGLGKTQTAIKYAYRYRNEYRAIFWVRASPPEQLTSDFADIASRLHLPERNTKDQNLIVDAVKQWMSKHAFWLLVLDNVEDFEIVQEIIPTARRGHILLTTRSQATGKFLKIEMNNMIAEEGGLLLLRRAGIIAPKAPLEAASENDREIAQQISRVMDGLPLALDQAGAYIQETGCGLADYLEQYKVRRAELLRYRGESSSDYPHSVATTWSLSFERIENANAAAADLLRACAFLHPDAIPEEFFTAGSKELGSAFQPLAEKVVTIDQIIKEILKYSLIRRNTRDKTLAIHRLVQAVLVDSMNEKTRCAWAERVIKAVNEVFLLDEAITSQPEQRYLLHAQTCAKLVNEWNFTFLAAAQLYSSTGKYLLGQGYYKQAESFCSKALDMFNRIPGAGAIDTCRCLTALMLTKADGGDLVEAELLSERLVAFCEEALGREHPYTVFSLYFLAELYLKRGKAEQAEPIIRRALSVCKSGSIPQGYPTGEILLSLAKLYSSQNNITQAETLYQEALMERERTFGPEHPKVAGALTELAIHYSSHGEPTKAEQLRKCALEIYTKSLDPDHPDIAAALAGLSVAHFSKGQYTEAEEYYEQALKIWERKFRLTPSGTGEPGSISDEPENFSKLDMNLRHMLAFSETDMGPAQGKEVATASTRLANSLIEQRKYPEAEMLLWHAFKISEKTLGKEDLVTVYCIGNLAKFYQVQKQYVFADFLYERAIKLAGVKFKFAPDGTKQIVENYMQFLRETGKEHQAAELQRHFDVLRNL